MQASKMLIPYRKKLIRNLLSGLIIIQLLTVLCDARRFPKFKNSTTNRIVDGEILKDHEYNEHVILLMTVPGSGVELCGGVLLEPDIVLTAAHCVKNYVNVPERIKVSSSQFEPASWVDPSEIVGVQKICVPKKYWKGFDKEYNDFAILSLKTEIPNYFEGKIAKNELEIGGQAVAVGIGFTHIDLKNPNNNKRTYRLRKIDMVRVECETFDQDLSHVCFESRFGGDTCYGDSGSPVFNENQEVVGLTSYGDDKQPCRHKPEKAKGVYADVVRNKKMISELIQQCL